MAPAGFDVGGGAYPRGSMERREPLAAPHSGSGILGAVAHAVGERNDAGAEHS